MQSELFQKGKYQARLAKNTADIIAAQRLRYRAFIDPQGDGRDGDAFDDICQHVLIETKAGGELVACYRLLLLQNGAGLCHSYAAQYYDLTSLFTYAGRMVEMGRFCIAPGLQDPDIVRIAWAMMTRFVDGNAVQMMFGCSSFAGMDGDAYLEAFAMLAHRFQAPDGVEIGKKARHIYPYQDVVVGLRDQRRSMRAVPPLLRTYLLMGGWVSDHAVIDRELNTLHVFTGLEVKAVPVERARALRVAAQSAPILGADTANDA